MGFWVRYLWAWLLMSDIYQGMRLVGIKELLEEERRKLNSGVVSSEHAKALASAANSLLRLVQLDMK